jgi:NADPH:quinone reductase-like Zn-dependent oxidoreductase
MKAVVLTDVTIAEDVKLSEYELPKVKSGWALVKVKAFGLNHSEKLLRLNEIRASYINKPIIPGIECVGEVIDGSDSGLKEGTKVMALMGGMGRSFNGSYAEYALLPSHHIFTFESDLSWEELGAIPETYYTAWGSLFECLNLKKEDVLLVRGGTCALGYAVIQFAKALGCTVIATTHKEEKIYLLNEIGADKIILDNGSLKGKIADVNKAVDLVGAKTLKDTLISVEKGGIVCHTGVLGGKYFIDNFDPIKDIPNRTYLTGFYSNYPTQKSIDEMMNFLNEYNICPFIGKVFDFNNINEALIALDNGLVNGKIVVKNYV